MKLGKITIVFLAVIGTVCSTGIVIRTVEQAESSELIAEAMVNILVSCYGNEEFAIGLHGNLPENFIETLWSRKVIPIVLMNATDRTHMLRLYRSKLNVFVIMATDWQQVFRGLSDLGYSRFYNRIGSFLIVDWTPTKKYGCYDVFNQILVAWTIKFFNVNVLCLHPTKGRIIFGYNPHTYQAPVPWLLTKIVKHKINQPLSIFEREYRQSGVCKNLDFDKVNDLGGRPIEIYQDSGGRKSRLEASISKYRNTLVYASEVHNIITVFLHKVNGTVKPVQVQSRSHHVKDITNRRVNAENALMAEITYPCMQLDLTIMTNFEGHKSQLRKILTVVDVYSRCGTCLVLLVTLIFFKFVVRQALIPATLNIVRIVCNTGFENVPENTASRIYLTGLLFFVVTIQGIFTGNLASLLTRDVPVEHPKTIQDLLENNYTIYVKTVYRHLFTDRLYKGRVVLLDSLGVDCTDYLLRDRSGACVDVVYMLIDLAPEHNVYLSSNIVASQYWALETERGWPFLDKFNKVLITMTETKIVDTFKMRLLRNRLSFVDPYDEDPKVMTLNDLGFAFVILGIGLVCATVSFIVEISIKPIRPIIAKVRRKLSNCFRKIKSRKLRVRKLKKKSVQRLVCQVN